VPLRQMVKKAVKNTKKTKTMTVNKAIVSNHHLFLF
jgi:hypothetical protein